ncbi:MAG: hypothetical protein ACR2FG_00055 [Marmoricola sp.]
MTYERVHDGVGIRRFAEMKRSDGTLVTASSTNGFELVRQFDWDITRPEQALSYAQLEAVVSEPWWGAQLPTYLLDQGAQPGPLRCHHTIRCLMSQNQSSSSSAVQVQA